MASLSQPTVIGKDALEYLTRVHVTDPQKWGLCAGTDFWLVANANGALTASGNNLITDGGWTATSLTLADGAAADFMTKNDVGTPGNFVQNAQNDLLKSPAIFCDYAHAHQAAVIMGRKELPRYFVVDMYARFSVVANDEATTNLGMAEDGGSIIVAADCYAAFNSDATNFRLNINGTRQTTITAVAVNTTPNWFRLVLDKAQAKVYASVNGTLIASGTLTDDECPLAFGAGSGGANNLVQLHQAHLFYAWRVPYDPQGF